MKSRAKQIPGRGPPTSLDTCLFTLTRKSGVRLEGAGSACVAPRFSSGLRCGEREGEMTRSLRSA
jgi:hypothetical protein